METKNTTKISVTIDPAILEKIKEGNYNRNKLIVSLFKKYIAQKKK